MHIQSCKILRWHRNQEILSCTSSRISEETSVEKTKDQVTVRRCGTGLMGQKKTASETKDPYWFRVGRCMGRNVGRRSGGGWCWTFRWKVTRTSDCLNFLLREFDGRKGCWGLCFVFRVSVLPKDRRLTRSERVLLLSEPSTFLETSLETLLCFI